MARAVENTCQCGCGAFVKNRFKRGHHSRGRTLEERFWEKVVKGPDCWGWDASTDSCGYGRIVVGPREWDSAHRVSYKLNIGPIPPGLEVCHSCDEPPCTNPAHLFLATHKENMHDMFLKGRNGQIALTRSQEKEVKSLLAEGWEKQWVADAYGIFISTIGYLKKRKFAGKADP